MYLIVEESHGRGYFYFRKPDGSVIKTYAEGKTIRHCNQ